MILLRIDDVGRAVDQPAWGTPDKGLGFFWRWREALGLAGLPVVYGVIPEAVGAEELRALGDRLSGGEELAVHGWDHREGAIVTREQMAGSLNLLRRSGIKCESYIPPFNIYDASTVSDWGKVCPGGFFLGGQYPRDQIYGHLPTRIGDAWHIGAYPDLYAHAHELVRRLPLIEAAGRSPAPVVLTLHTVWDVNHLDEARRVVETAKPYLIPADRIPNYRKAVGDYADALQSVERIAAKPIRDLTKPFARVLSPIPNESLDGLFDLMGCRIVRNLLHAEANDCEFAVDYLSRWPSLDLFGLRLQTLLERLKPGGTLFVVAPYAPFEPRAENEAAAVFSAKQHDDMIAELHPAVDVVDDFPFKTGPIAERCPPEHADAIFYALRRK